MKIKFNHWAIGLLLVLAIAVAAISYDPIKRTSNEKSGGISNSKNPTSRETTSSASSPDASPSPVTHVVNPSQWVFPAPGNAGTKLVDVIPGTQPANDKQPQAEVQAGGVVYRVTPNDNGYFGQIDVAAKQKLKVKVYLPDGQPGDDYVVQLEDGGKLLEQKLPAATSLRLDDARQLDFGFQVSDQAGIYRVVLRSGGNVKVLNFWVGPELPVSVAR